MTRDRDAGRLAPLGGLASLGVCALLAAPLLAQPTAAPAARLPAAAQPGNGTSEIQPGSDELPDSPAGRRVRAFFEAMNAGSADAYEAYSQANRSAAGLARGTPARRAEQYAEFTRMWGGLTVQRVFVESDGIVVFAHAQRHDEMVQFTFMLAPGPEAKIDALRIEPAGSPALYNIQNSPAWQNWDTLAGFLGAVRADTGIPSLAAAVIKDGRIVESATVGVTRFGGEQAVGPEARFHWGSVTKSLTATAIATLVERGAISWDTTIADVFPDVPMRGEFKSATLRQLLSHTAGIPQYTEIDGATGGRMAGYPGSPVEKRHAFMLDLLNESPLFTPGEGFRYSNAGIGVAAHMAEVAGGVAWEDLIRTAVFEPLGMTTAGLGLPSELGDDQPVGHMGMGPEFRPTMGGVPDLAPIWPAGNVCSDIEDLARYAAFHLKALRLAASAPAEGAGEKVDGVLLAATVASLHEPAPSSIGGFGPGGYALGWGLQDWPTNGVHTHAHNGSAGTYYATIRLFPDLNMAIVTLMNVGEPGDNLAPLIERAIYDHFE